MTSKWTNVDAGPRQIKNLQRLMNALLNEGRTRTELYGVIGGKESRSAVMSLMGPVRDEVTALDEKIREQFGNRITRANVNDIALAYAGAIDEAQKSRPVDDQRRTQAEDAELQAKQVAREAEYQAQQDAQNQVLNQVLAKAPAGAKALIYAELHEDTSGPYDDSRSSWAVRTVAIGFRHSSREDFRALRRAAAGFPETAHMADEDTLTAWQVEHYGREWGKLEYRENYSMGAGNYLSDHGSAHGSSGWVVRSRDFPCKWVALTEDAIPAASAPAAVTASGSGVTVSPSSIGRAGVVEVRFGEKPAREVLDGLKAHGFRWARGNQCWYGRDVAYAEALRDAS